MNFERQSMRRYALLILIALAPPAVARAEDCANATDQVTMDDCAAADAKKSDAELNALYKQIRQRLKSDAATTKLLVHTQQAWVAFRDAECDFSASGVAGGTIYPMIRDICIDGLTQQRIKDFKRYLTCEEGDMNCPAPAN
jgi:uncharacterized protein YecT (DUF1311 family)